MSCQDAGECRLVPVLNHHSTLVAVVSDGAGSASEAEEGAKLACSMFSDEIVSFLESGGCARDVSREFTVSVIEGFQREIARRADAKRLTPRDFACTLLAAVVDEHSAVFLQIGDGAIVLAEQKDPDQYCWVFWPQRGEYENQTSFATDADATDRLEHEFDERSIDEVALFTDGLQRIALHYQSQTAYAPFFRPMFAPLRAAPTGFSSALSSLLLWFLDSQSVNDRTDDDKTLILATRRAAGISADHRHDADEREDQTEGL